MIQEQSKLTAFLLSFLFLTFCAFSQNAHAQRKIDSLNNGNITFFVQDMTEITSGNDASMPQGHAIKFLERHLHPNARFKSAISYNMPGFPAQENSISLNKEQFIENIQAGSQTLEDYETSVEVRDIKISRDGRKATLNTIGYERGTMSASDQQFPVEGNSFCTQIVKLSDKGVIQIYHANCKTTIQFQEY